MSTSIDVDNLVVCSVCAGVVPKAHYADHERWHQHLIDQITSGNVAESSAAQRPEA